MEDDNLSDRYAILFNVVLTPSQPDVTSSCRPNKLNTKRLVDTWHMCHYKAVL